MEKTKNTFTVVDENGKTKVYEVLFTFFSEETKENYIVFTDGTKDEKGKMKVYASVFNPNAQNQNTQSQNAVNTEVIKNAIDLTIDIPQAEKKLANINLADLQKKKEEKPKEEKKEEIKKIKIDTKSTAPKSPKKITFKYTVKKSNGSLMKGTFDALNIDQVRMFLNAEGYEIINIVPAGKFDINFNFGTKLKAGELSFALTQLSTYIKAGIPLIDAVRILAKQTVKANKRKIYESIVYELLTGQSFSSALERQSNIFPKLLVNMVKTAEMTGDLPAILDDMAEYYTSMDQTRKQLISAMTYPTIVLIFAVFVLTFVLVWVVPKFVTLFKDNNSKLPGITQVIIAMSDFLSNNLFYVIIGLTLVLGTYMFLFKKIKSFRRTMQTFYMRLPVIGNIMIYSEVTMFTKTLASLLNHGVFITNSMEILSKVSNNELYRDIIKRTIDNLTNKGGKISESFYGQWFFPIVAYEMIVTGENTGQLGLMMEKVSQYYQDLHKNTVTSLKSLIEPIMIGFLAIAVGIIILSIILPMFSLYDVIQG